MPACVSLDIAYSSCLVHLRHSLYSSERGGVTGGMEGEEHIRRATQSGPHDPLHAAAMLAMPNLLGS